MPKEPRLEIVTYTVCLTDKGKDREKKNLNDNAMGFNCKCFHNNHTSVTEKVGRCQYVNRRVGMEACFHHGIEKKK